MVSPTAQQTQNVNSNGLNILNRKLRVRSAGVLRIWSLALILLLPGCSLAPSISVVRDEPIERMLRDEAERILSVTADATDTARYQISLSDFPRADILGMSIGQRRIYISYKLGRRALHSRRDLWLLRQILAHEIAHGCAGSNATEGLVVFVAEHLDSSRKPCAEELRPFYNGATGVATQVCPPVQSFMASRAHL